MHLQESILFLPNAWDVISAMVLEQSGFKAIGTTSWGISNALGYQDGENIAFSELLDSVSKMVAAVDIPVSVDVEAGYSINTEEVANNVLKIAELGAVGINIEDSLKNEPGLQEYDKQCGLIEEIRNKLDQHGHQEFFINARVDTYFQRQNPLSETISRSIGYINSGADGVFVPGLKNSDEIKQLVDVIDAPLNILSLPGLTDATSLNQLGVKRFSLGNALSDATTAFIEQKAEQLFSKLNTSSLYQDNAVKTSFR